MERAAAPQLRKSLEMAGALKDIGLRFVPMPVIDDDDFAALCAEMQRRLEEVEKLCI